MLTIWGSGGRNKKRSDNMISLNVKKVQKVYLRKIFEAEHLGLDRFYDIL